MAIVLVALTTRELGGTRFAQRIAAWGFGFAAFPLVTGHVLLTATVDLVVWAAVVLCVVRALGGRPRWWLAAGVVVGLGLFNKLLIVLLLVGLAVGLASVGRVGCCAHDGCGAVSCWRWSSARRTLPTKPRMVAAGHHGRGHR